MREVMAGGGDRVERMTAVSSEGSELRYALIG